MACMVAMHSQAAVEFFRLCQPDLQDEPTQEEAKRWHPLKVGCTSLIFQITVSCDLLKKASAAELHFVTCLFEDKITSRVL